MGDAHEPRRQGQQPRKGQQFDGRASGRCGHVRHDAQQRQSRFWEVVLPEEAQPIEVATLRVVLDASTENARCRGGHD